MNKHYREALIKAAADQLKEQEGIETVDMDVMNTVLEYPEWDDAEWDEKGESSFEGDTEMLVDMYLLETEDEDEEEETPEQSIEDICAQLHVGFNLVPGIGIGYCKDEEDLEKMRNFVRGGLAVQEMMAQMLGL